MVYSQANGPDEDNDTKEFCSDDDDKTSVDEDKERFTAIHMNVLQLPDSTKYHAVTRGRKSEIFESWTGLGGAMEQVEGYKLCIHEGFSTLEHAWLFMVAWGFDAAAGIPFYPKAFKPLPNFTPQPNAPFKQEFRRFVAVQNLTEHEVRKARIDAISKTLIQYCLPGRITIDQEDEVEGTILTKEQKLFIYH